MNFPARKPKAEAPAAPKAAPKVAEQPVEKVSEVLKVSKVEGEEAKA